MGCLARGPAAAGRTGPSNVARGPRNVEGRHPLPMRGSGRTFRQVRVRARAAHPTFPLGETTMASSHESGASFLLHAVKPEDVVVPDDLGEEELMLARTMRDFSERDVAPVMDALLAGDRDTVRRLFEKAAELGLFMLEVPEAYGGLDLNVLAVTGMCTAARELGPMNSVVFGHQGIGTLPIVYFGTPEQVEKYLHPCMDGRMLSAFALTEPSSGSDAMNIHTKAVLDEAGGHFVLNGTKQWITNAGWADLFVLFAKVDGEHFTAFLVERDTPGLEVAPPERLLGQHGSSVCALSLENVRVPVENVLGEVGKGHKVAFCTLNMGRLKLSATSSAGAAAALEAATVYAAQRVQFGQPIAGFGLIRRKLADMGARAWASETVAFRTAGLVYRALEAMKERGEVSPDERLRVLAEFSVECAMAKVYASEAYNGVADEAVQVFGGYGFSEEYPPAHMYRDSRITRIYEGTNEICRLYAQRSILKRFAGMSPQDLAAMVASEGRGAAPERGTGSFSTLPGALASFKTLYGILVRDSVEHLGPDRIADADHQQFLSSLADIVIEIYAAESVVLRVEKLGFGSEEPEGAEHRALALLVFERAADRIRTETRTVLAELYQGEELRARLARIEPLLPLPHALIEARALVAAKLVEREGRLPEGRA